MGHMRNTNSAARGLWYSTQKAALRLGLRRDTPDDAALAPAGDAPKDETVFARRLA